MPSIEQSMQNKIHTHEEQFRQEQKFSPAQFVYVKTSTRSNVPNSEIEIQITEQSKRLKELTTQ